MKFILIFLTLVLGFCDAARRTATTASTAATFEERQLGQRGQTQENVWDLIELQKLDKQADFWEKNPTLAANTTESEDSSALSGRQSYQGPGDTNELPGPIATIEPIPILKPPPGCYALRGQFPSSTNCANYLNCWDAVVIEQSCPDGLLFNAVSLVCDYDYNVNCGSRPLPTPKPPLPTGSKSCPDPNGRYRSATNCSEFYVCVFGRPVKFSCPRGLVYNDVLDVCDYSYNVDCKGTATPKPPIPPITVWPITEPPSSPPPQPPTYGPGPSYGSSPPPQPAPSYSINPWLNTKTNHETWHQPAESLEVEKDEGSLFNGQQQPSEAFPNSWNVLQNIPASLVAVPCENGNIHRLNEGCTNVVVCRNDHPQLVRCSSGLMYDRQSDTCQPPSIAKC